MDPYTTMVTVSPAETYYVSDIANMAFVDDTYFGIEVTYNSTESILPPPPASPIASSPITSSISGMSNASYHTVMYSVRFPNMEDCVERATKLVKTYTWNERFTYLFIQHNVNPYPFAYARTELTYILTPIWVVLYFVSLTIFIVLVSCTRFPPRLFWYHH